MTVKQLRVGTRGSKLALAQTGQVVDALRALDPDLAIEPVVVDSADSTIMDKSRYVSSIEEQLRSHEIDLAVHSAKDVPGEDVPGLLIVAVPERVTPYDTLLGAESLEDLKEGATVGTSSLRRAAQLLAARPDLKIEPLRGNIDTRLGRLTDGDYDAIVLALAGLERLGRQSEATSSLAEMIPAAGQGVLALTVRDEDSEARAAAGVLDDPVTHACLLAERALVRALEADCHTPVGAHATVAADGTMSMSAFAGREDGSAWVRDSLTTTDTSDPEALGSLVAERLRSAGADEVLGR